MSRLGRPGCGTASARLVSAVFVLLLVVSSCSTTGSEPDARVTSASQPSSTATPSTSRPPVTDLEAAGAKRLDVVGDWLTVTDDGVWIAGKNSKRLPELFRLAPADGKVVSSLPFRSAQCGGAAVWDGYLWTATVAPTGVAKIDTRRSKIIKEVQLKTPDELDCELTSGAGEGGVWVIINAQDCVQCRIAKLDRNLRTMAAIPVKAGAAAVRAGLGSVWVSNPEEDVVEQIDPKTLKVVNQIPTGDRPRYMAIGAGSVWALAQVDGTITRYTPATKKTMRIEANLPGAGGDLTFGAGSVWARGAADRLLVRLDPASNQVVAEYGPAVGAGAVAVGHGAVWISAYNAKKVWRLPLPK
jgi:virginiamycin B lyase